MFYGREDILGQLGDLLKRRTASLVTCRGRRRIGKSTLIEEFARRNRLRFLKLEGLSPRESDTDAKQLAAFSRQLGAATGKREKSAANWFDAFARLDAAIEDVPTVVFLDEISWMGKYDPDFPGELKYAWDNRFKRHDRLIMVICGSVSTWITKNILRSKGFVGRPALNLVVGELPLSDCLKFWGKKASRISDSEIFDILSVVGGVPKYLELVDPSASAETNIRKLCFTPGGLLAEEFYDIFDDVFDGGRTVERRILVSLAESSRTGAEIAERLGMDNNGHFQEKLEALEIAGFIARDGGLNPETGRPARIVRYRICDNYSRFFLKYVEPVADSVRKGLFRFSSLAQLSGWNTVLGLQFECLVLNNLPELLKRMGLSDVLILSAAPYRKRAHARGEGCQIDLLLISSRTWWVVEIKRRREIGTEIIDEVAHKVRNLKVAPGVSVRTALVYCGALSPAVTAEGYFDILTDAHDILRAE